MLQFHDYLSIATGDPVHLPIDFPIVFISCKVLQDLFERCLPADVAGKVTYLDYGLHVVPRKLTRSLQEALDQIEEPSLVVLGYGLCGNGLHGIKAGKHTLLLPRTDDCIAILLGSRDVYMEHFENNPATYYLSKGWLEAGSNPLKQYQDYVQKYGSEQADWLMDQQYRNYRRLVYVAHSPDDLSQYRDRAAEVAEYCQRWDMKYSELIGSDRYIRRLADAVSGKGELNEDFIVVKPGEVIDQSQFIR